MKKLGLVFSLALFFSISSQVTAQGKDHTTLDSSKIFIPLNVGNTWQYLEVSHPSISIVEYDLTYSIVERDTLINGLLYFKLSGHSDLMRYSPAEKKIFVYWNDADRVYVDFSIPDGTHYQSFDQGQYRTVTSEIGTIDLFNLNRNYGGYLYMMGGWGENVHYADSIGLNYYGVAGSHFDDSDYILQAILFDSLGIEKHYTMHQKPAFEIEPINKIDSITFYLPFKVTHPYTKVVSYPSYGLDFIDSVKMFSYYEKDDSIILNLPIIPTHSLNPVNIDYLVTLQLDTALMKNGFTFNYKFIAKDKGIIPEYASAPDSGNYQCSWDETTNIEVSGNIIPASFSLEQNYPNPFNPVTTIKYQLPKSGLVQLKIFNLLGSEVAVLVNEMKSEGEHSLNFDASDLPSGVYLYKLQAGNFVEIKKLMLLK